MKNASSEVFDLIKSMTKTEKRYFKLYAARHYLSENQYTKLFSLIDKQQVYHEKELAVLFAGKKSAAHFAVIKKQLYENILEALHRYDEFAQPEQKIRKGIHYCELLLKKGLFEQCSRQIKKYKSLATKLEKFENLIELIEIEKRLINKKQFTTVSYAGIENLQQDQNELIRQLTITGNYWEQSSRIYKLHYEKKIAPGKLNQELETLTADPLFTKMDQATTFKSKLDFLQVNALHAFVNGDIKKAYSLNTEFLTLLDDHEHLKQLHTDRYFSVLNNYLIDSLILKKYTELEKGIQTLRSLQLKPEFRAIQNLEATIFRQSYLLEMNYYVSTEKFDLALNCVPIIEAGLKKYRSTIAVTNVITLRYLIAYTLFCARDFKKCLDQLLELLQLREAESVTDLYRDSRILQMLCHFELGDFMLVESMITSLLRTVLAGKIRYETHRIVIRYIRQSIQKIEKPDLNSLQKKLTILSTQQEESHLFNNFNYIYWASEVTRQLK